MKRREFIALTAVVTLAVVALVPGVLTAVARDTGIQVRNTIQCSAFKRMSDGTWYVAKPTTFRIGKFKKATFTPLSIGPDFFSFEGVDLYKVLESKCGARATAGGKGANRKYAIRVWH